MKRALLGLILLFPLSGLALELKVGDILLQPLDCWACTLIEQQENTIYSHMGLVIQTTPTVLVVESLDNVHSVSLEKFNTRTEKGMKLGVFRLQNERAQTYFEDNSKKLFDYFNNTFAGLTYDKEFLWNNFDEKGLEKMYCSEMITKLIQGFIHIEIPTKKMKFDKNRDQWLQYFNGNPPDNKPGNSPADFEKSDLFYKVGEL